VRADVTADAGKHLLIPGNVLRLYDALSMQCMWCCPGCWLLAGNRGVIIARLGHGCQCNWSWTPSIVQSNVHVDERPTRVLVLLQAEALPRLCSVLWLAGGLRELELDFLGRAADPVSARVGGIGRLTQLCSLQLRGMQFAVRGDHLMSTLSPLTQLTRLGLCFDWDHLELQGRVQSDWQHAVCKLTKLQELRIESAEKYKYDCGSMHKGALLAVLSRLSALRHLAVLGMKEWDAQAVSDQLHMEALPALETVALQLHTL